jgi:hypothetical protein
MRAYNAYGQYHLIHCHLARIERELFGSNVDESADLAIRRTRVVAVCRVALLDKGP